MGRLDNMKPAASAPHSRVLVCSTTLRDFSRWALGRQFDVGSAKGRIDGRGVVRLAPAVSSVLGPALRGAAAAR
jgi:hypothetical protein